MAKGRAHHVGGLQAGLLILGLYALLAQAFLAGVMGGAHAGHAGARPGADLQALDGYFICAPSGHADAGPQTPTAPAHAHDCACPTLCHGAALPLALAAVAAPHPWPAVAAPASARGIAAAPGVRVPQARAPPPPPTVS